MNRIIKIFKFQFEFSMEIMLMLHSKGMWKDFEA